MLTAACFLALSVVAQVTVDGDLRDIIPIAQASSVSGTNSVCGIGRSGFDISGVFVYYSTGADAVFVGIDIMDVPPGLGLGGHGVPGDADGDGNPDSPATNWVCTGDDEDGVGPDEFYWIFLDPTANGQFSDSIIAEYRDNRLDFISWPARTPIIGATGTIALGTAGAPHHPTHIPNENPNTFDIELRVDHWSRFDQTPREFTVTIIANGASDLQTELTAPVYVNLGPSPCARGTVGLGSGETTSVLHVNGDDVQRFVSRGEPIDVSLDAAPAGPVLARYALWIWAGERGGSFDVVARSESLGCAVGPVPIGGSSGAQPFRCLRSADLPARLCGPLSEPNAPPRAPWTITRRRGFSVPITLTLQGILEDSGASNAVGYSVTNAVVVDVR
ncbi:MAG: hypothetical protein HY292_03220 [Planctomycetes bacterium]|nr:hypothetical protein [Planctomycetota bacterium]